MNTQAKLLHQNILFIQEKTKADFIGPSSILFNIFINNLFLWISKSNLNTFVDDNTISEAENTIREGN